MEKIDFSRALSQIRQVGIDPMPEKVSFKIPQARAVLNYFLRYLCHGAAQWLPEYEEVAAWLGDNGGRGLLCFGNCGRGKTLLCRSAIPMILQTYCRRIVTSTTAVELNADPDRWKRFHLLCIDDVGTEGQSVRYGERRIVFNEIVDEAERQGKLLLLTTNLSLEELHARYGERTTDRLIALTKRVKFTGPSLRH